MTPDELRMLVAHDEDDTVERKRLIDLDSKKGRAEFIRDMIALANTHSAESRFLLLGIDDDGTVVGIPDFKKEDADLQQMLHEWVEPPIRFSFNRHDFEGAVIGVIEIQPSVDRPHVTLKQLTDSDNHTHFVRGDTWIRRGSRKDRPTGWDHLRFRDDFARHHTPRPVLDVTFVGDSRDFPTTSDWQYNSFRVLNFSQLPPHMVPLRFFVHNRGRAEANNIVVEITVPEDYGTVRAPDPRGGGHLAWPTEDSRQHRVTRFRGDTLLHGDVNSSIELYVQFPRKGHVYELTWKAWAREIPDPVTGILTVTILA